MDIVSVTVTLFLVMDPFGNMPIFLSILERVPPERRRSVLIRELLFALAIIVGCILLGKYVMSILGLRREAVSIAGGIVLFLIALRMVFPRRAADADETPEGEPFLVPLAIPLVAGPSTLAVLLLLSSAGPSVWPQLLLAATVAWSGSFILLVSATFLSRFLTRRGLIAMERLMGMILIALSVQLLLDGLGNYLGKS